LWKRRTAPCKKYGQHGLDILSVGFQDPCNLSGLCTLSSISCQLQMAQLMALPSDGPPCQCWASWTAQLPRKWLIDPRNKSLRMSLHTSATLFLMSPLSNCHPLILHPTHPPLASKAIVLANPYYSTQLSLMPHILVSLTYIYTLFSTGHKFFWGSCYARSSQSVVRESLGFLNKLSKKSISQNYFHNNTSYHLTLSLSFFHNCMVEFSRGHMTCYITTDLVQKLKIQLSSMKPDTTFLTKFVVLKNKAIIIKIFMFMCTDFIFHAF
jgi:hypothetical protein